MACDSVAESGLHDASQSGQIGSYVTACLPRSSKSKNILRAGRSPNGERMAISGLLAHAACGRLPSTLVRDFCFVGLFPYCRLGPTLHHGELRSHIFKATHYGQNFRFLQNAVGFLGSNQDGLYEFMAGRDSPL
jgi:hypothetical protein